MFKLSRQVRALLVSFPCPFFSFFSFLSFFLSFSWSSNYAFRVCCPPINLIFVCINWVEKECLPRRIVVSHHPLSWELLPYSQCSTSTPSTCSCLSPSVSLSASKNLFHFRQLLTKISSTLVVCHWSSEPCTSEPPVASSWAQWSRCFLSLNISSRIMKQNWILASVWNVIFRCFSQAHLTIMKVGTLWNGICVKLRENIQSVHRSRCVRNITLDLNVPGKIYGFLLRPRALILFDR